MTSSQIILAILASSGFFSLLALFIQRFWAKKDRKSAGNDAVIVRLDRIETTLENHINEDREQDIRQARRDILRFNDEVRRGTPHTEESFDDILDCIDTYERYCSSHPDFANSKAVMAVDNIKRVYQERLVKNDFL